LTTALLEQGFTEDLLIEAGVAGRARTGRVYDRMRNRLIFPILDQGGRPCGFAGRLISGDGPKYLNTPETDLYRKRSLLYGLNLAEKPIWEAGQAIVVEGYLDVIACHQAGFTNTVATAGTALTPEHLASLNGITSGATLAFDGDQAGHLAITRVAEHHVDHSLRIRVAHLPAGRDPADLLSGDGALFVQALADAIPIEHHLISETVLKHSLDEPGGVARAVHKAGELVAAIQDLDTRDRAVALVASLVNRPESDIRRYMSQSLKGSRHRRVREQGLSVV
jgi:DNA primase